MVAYGVRCGEVGPSLALVKSVDEHFCLITYESTRFPKLFPSPCARTCNHAIVQCDMMNSLRFSILPMPALQLHSNLDTCCAIGFLDNSTCDGTEFKKKKNLLKKQKGLSTAVFFPPIPSHMPVEPTRLSVSAHLSNKSGVAMGVETRPI
jgi:hypothetical protein